MPSVTQHLRFPLLDSHEFFMRESGDYSKIFARIIFEWITHPIGLLRIATDLALGIGIRIDVSFEEPHDMTHFKEE